MPRNKTRIRLSLCTLFLLILFGACQPAIQQVPVSAKQELAPPPSLSVEALDRRILFLSHLLETPDLSRDDRDLAQDLLASYRGLKVAAESGSLKQNYAPMIQILLRNLDQMEERYFTARKGEDERFCAEGVRQFELKRKEITEAFSAGDDQTVIDGVLDLERTFGPDSLTPDLSLLFALSLGKKGTFTTALSIGQDVSRQLESQPDLLQLRAQMIDWELALGNEKEAKEIYDKLRLKFSEREAVVRSLEQKFPAEAARGALPESTAPTEEVTKADLDRQVRETVARADEMVQKGDFE